MKKLLALLLALVMMLSFAACGQEAADDQTTDDQKQEEVVEPVEEDTEDDTEEDAGLPEIKDSTEKVTFAAYSFKVNGTEVTNETLKDLHIYKITSTSTNSKGVTSEATYCGYKLADVLAACGIENATSVTAVANDAYESKIAEDLINSDYTLVAIEKDKEVGEDGTIWLAPCSSTTGNVYCKLVVEIKAE